MSDFSIDSDVHDRSLGSVGEDLEREEVDARERCSEDSKHRVIGISIIEDDLVELEGASDMSCRVVCRELSREGYLMIHCICGIDGWMERVNTWFLNAQLSTKDTRRKWNLSNHKYNSDPLIGTYHFYVGEV